MKKIKSDIKLLIRGVTFLFQIEKHYALLHIISSLLNPLQPYINIYMVAKILNELSTSREWQVLSKYVILLISANFIFKIVLSALNLSKEYHSNLFYKNERMFFAKKSMFLDFSYIENPEIHALLERIKNESQNGYNLFFLNMFLGQLLGNISMIVFSITLCSNLIIDGKIKLYIKIIILFTVIIVIIVNYYTTKVINQKNMGMYADLIPYNVKFNYYNEYNENYNTGKDVRIYHLQDYLVDLQKNQNEYATHLLDKTKKSTLKYVFINTFLSNFLDILIYTIVTGACLQGRVQVGHITQYVTSVALLVSAIEGVITQFQALFNNNQYMQNYFKYFDIPSASAQSGDKVVPDCLHEIEFRNVSFRYPHTDVNVLDNVTLKIRIGEKIALVGMNGSGKTTMIKLICRLYQPTQGEILLDGININSYNYDEYLNKISVVFQDFEIFAFSLIDNIVLGDESDEQEVLDILKKVGFEKTLMKLTKGINTSLYKDFDEEGFEISGGEAQKIALARAVYKDAPIIILDEPTSALDPMAEYEMYTKFNLVTNEKTVIYISHRLAACTFCDRIFVLHEGKLVQNGYHEELIRDKKGKYWELWNAQAQYYKNK